jgi:xanthine dehydrogenase YagR molybdenum-binding subunit
MMVGQSIDRRDAHLKVRGQASYAGEFSQPNMAYAVLVQSTIPAGKVIGFDTAVAREMTGVIDIITTENADKLQVRTAAQQTVLFPLLQSSEVFYNGQTIGLVIAETSAQARAAAAKVAVRYEPTEAVTMMDAALGQAYEPKNFRNGQTTADSKTGDPDAAFAASPVKLDATYQTPIEHHNPMEPHVTIANWQGDQLRVWTATQGISGARQTLSSLFGLPKNNVTIICPFVGGGFGSKGNTWPPATIAAMAARRVKRPVKLEVTREQMFTSNGYRPRTFQHIRLGADRDGKLLAISHDGLTQMSRPELGEFAEPVALATRMLYASDNISTSHRLVSVNQGLPTYMRAPGEAAGNFALESAMDELAVALNMDPLALRLRNYAAADATTGKPFASKPLRACYEQAAEAFGWHKRTAQPGSMRDGRSLIGMGMATSTYPTNRMPASASVRLSPDGTALVRSGTQDIGTGTYTTMAQVAADELGLPLDRVRVELGDSRLPPAPVSGGSMTTASVLPAVRDAAAQVRDRILDLSKAQGNAVGHGPGDRHLADGIVHGPGGAVRVADVMARGGVPFVEATSDQKPDAGAQQYARHAFGAQFCEVRVDVDLRTIKVSRWVGAFDCGTVINEKTARSQLIGGIVFGIGMALLEETRVDSATGRIVNANIADYLMPVNADVPEITTIMVGAPDLVTTPMGVKGIGELPTVGAAAAIANAVYHATGTRVRDLPVRLDKLMA